MSITCLANQKLQITIKIVRTNTSLLHRKKRLVTAGLFLFVVLFLLTPYCSVTSQFRFRFKSCTNFI